MYVSYALSRSGTGETWLYDADWMMTMIKYFVSSQHIAVTLFVT